jgi:hypothetical protein
MAINPPKQLIAICFKLGGRKKARNPHNQPPATNPNKYPKAGELR